MPDVAVSSLEFRQQMLADKARAALERGNHEYTIAACAQILKTAPACVAVRRLQRAAVLRRGRGGWGTRMAARLRMVAAAWRISGADAATTLARCEAVLLADPTAAGALKRLAELATENEWRETAVFAREAVLALRPHDRTNARVGRGPARGGTIGRCAADREGTAPVESGRRHGAGVAARGGDHENDGPGKLGGERIVSREAEVFHPRLTFLFIPIL